MKGKAAAWPLLNGRHHNPSHAGCEVKVLQSPLWPVLPSHAGESPDNLVGIRMGPLPLVNPEQLDELSEFTWPDGEAAQDLQQVDEVLGTFPIQFVLRGAEGTQKAAHHPCLHTCSSTLKG